MLWIVAIVSGALVLAALMGLARLGERSDDRDARKKETRPQPASPAVDLPKD